MSVRRDNKKYDELEMQSTGVPKQTQNEIREAYRLQEQDNFIRKGYLLCLLLFLATGVGIVTAVLEGTYKDAIFAEQILVTVFGTIYMILFIIMVCCYTQSQLRIALLLFTSLFIGTVGGFMIAANLKVVISHLKDEQK
tara:strand:+ start:811 stop:1227 length:417 start_codon:yes stop_codon:yes gene_type:complete